MCLPVICLRLFILISTSQCNIKQITLADRFAMLAVVRLRSETYGSTITAQAARQDSAEFKILAMRSWRENESPWSEFVQFFAEVSDIFRLYFYNHIQRYCAWQALANELRQDIRSLQSRTVLKVWAWIFFTFFSHILTAMISCFLNLIIDGLANSQYLMSKSIQNMKPCGLFRWF